MWHSRLVLQGLSWRIPCIHTQAGMAVLKYFISPVDFIPGLTTFIVVCGMVSPLGNTGNSAQNNVKSLQSNHHLPFFVQLKNDRLGTDRTLWALLLMELSLIKWSLAKSLNLHIKEIIYRILQKHSKRLKSAHFCSGSPFTPKRHMLSFWLQSLLLLLFLLFLIFLLFPSTRTSRAFSLRGHLSRKHLTVTHLMLRLVACFLEPYPTYSIHPPSLPPSLYTIGSFCDSFPLTSLTTKSQEGRIFSTLPVL